MASSPTWQRVLRIRILGAGVAGLAAASLLAADGHEVEILDDRFTVPRVGTTLGLFPPAQRVLERIGILEAVRERSTAPRQGRLIGAGGRAIATIPAGGALLVPRSHLITCLQDALPGIVVRRTGAVADVRPLRRRADVLVGADGVHSLTRRSGWGEGTRARRRALTVLRGTADIPPPDISETWGGCWVFGITPLFGERTNWFASLPEHRAADRAGDLAHLQEVAGGVRTPIDEVLAAARPRDTLVHGISTVPPVRPVRENVVLIGDAAHAMAPNLGHGANTALSDAGALATALRGPGSVRASLAAYALRRHVPDQAWRAGSELMMHVTGTDRGAPLRDRVLAAGGRLLPS